MACENPLHIKNPRYKKMSDLERVTYSMRYFGTREPP